MSTVFDDAVGAEKSAFIHIEVEHEHFTGHKQIVAFRGRVESVLNKVKHPKVMVDLNQVKSISSAAVGELLSADIKASHKGGQLWLVRPGRQVRDVFAALKLDDILTIKQTVSEAVVSIPIDAPVDQTATADDGRFKALQSPDPREAPKSSGKKKK